MKTTSHSPYLKIMMLNCTLLFSEYLYHDLLRFNNKDFGKESQMGP